LQCPKRIPVFSITVFRILLSPRTPLNPPPKPPTFSEPLCSRCRLGTGNAWPAAERRESCVFNTGGLGSHLLKQYDVTDFDDLPPHGEKKFAFLGINNYYISI